MSNQFLKLRRSAVPGKIPDTGSLDLGEIALNTHDGLAFMKKSVSGVESVVTIGNTTGSFTGSFSGQFTGSLLGTASWAYNAVTASTADDFYVRGNITGSNALITGTLTAQRLVVQTISSSVIYSSGSNIFGDELTDTQQFTGSVTMTGSLTVNGPSTFNGRVTANNLTGSLFGTSSWALNAISASHAPTALSASYAISSSNASTASFALGGNGTFSGSFSGSFFGNGGGLTNISASSVVGLNLSLISSGSVTASTDPAYGFRVNSNSQISGSTQITGSLGVTGSVNISGSIGNIFSANVDTLVFTGSLYQTGSSFFTGSVSITGSLTVNGPTVLNQGVCVNGDISGSRLIIGSNHTMSGTCSSIAAGFSNSATGNCSFVGGGSFNTGLGAASFVGGGRNNIASGNCSFVGGGQFNTGSSAWSFIGGGCGNSVSGTYSAIAGGFCNTISTNQMGFIGAGRNNTVSGYTAAVVSGYQSTASGCQSFVGGGVINTASGNQSTVVGGTGNTASGTCSFVGGGTVNTASGYLSFIGGGAGNCATNAHSVVAGGNNNRSTGTRAVIVGGISNFSCGLETGVVAGGSNTASGNRAFIGAGALNIATGNCSFIGGGDSNNASGDRAIIVGGLSNNASGFRSAILGGSGNNASACWAGAFGCNLAANVDCHFFVNNLMSCGNITGSNAFISSTLTAQTVVAQSFTASTQFITGSTRFGSQLTDTHQFTGSVNVTGSLTVAGYSSLTGSFNGQGNLTGSFNGQATLTGSFTGSFNGVVSGSFSGSVANIDGQTNFIAKYDSPNSIDSSVIYQSASHIAINEVNFTANDPEALYVFQTHPTSINVITGKGNHNNYLQLNIQNTNQGISASSDIVATANNGNEFSNYIDMGINSENFNTGFIGEANDAYVYSIANNLHIGNAATNGTHLGFFVGGDDVEANMKLQLNPNNRHTMSGSLSLTGSLNVLEGITGSLYGTSSWAISASHAPTALSSSYAISASYAISSSLAANSILLNGTSSGVFATTGSNIFKASQTIDGNLFMSGAFRLIYNDSPTNNMLFGMFDGGTIHGPYYQLFGNQYSNVDQRGSAEFVYDNRNGGGSGFNIASFNGSTWTRKFRVDDNGAQVTGSLNVTGGITGSLYGTASWAENALTASSADNFFVRQDVTASNALITGTLTAQTIIAQYITSSTEFITGSTKFGTQLTDTHQFTGSVTVTGSLSLNNDPVVTQTPYNTFSSSIALRATNLESTASVLTSASASFASDSGSNSIRITNLESTASVLTTASASFAIVSASYASASGSLSTRVTTLEQASASFAQQSGSNSIRFTNLETTASVLTVASASFALVSASYSSASGSLSIRTTNLETTASVLTQASASFASDSGSNSIRITNLESTASVLTTASASFATVSASFSATSQSISNRVSIIEGNYATTGSNVFVGDQTVTGSLFTSGSNTLVGSTTLTGSLNITGSTVQIGNNTLLGNTTLSGSIIISGTLGSTPSVKIYGDTQHNGYIRFDPVTTNIDTSISASYIFVSGSTQDLYFSQNGKGYSNVTRLRWLEGNLYTGLLNGGLITSQSSTTYQVGSGSGIIVNLNASLNDNPYPTTTYVNWPNLTGNINQFSASYDQTFVGISSTGTLVSQSTAFLNGQVDTQIPVGYVAHQDNSTINATVTEPSLAYGWKQRSNVFISAFGPLKLSGFNLAVSGSSTGSLVVGSGTAFLDGGNYQTDPNNPSYVTATGTSTSRIFRYYESGSDWIYDTNAGAGYGAIDPARYSNNGTLSSVGAGNWSIQRVFFFPTSPLSPKPIIVYYGNAIYATEAEAIANIPIEPFTEAPSTSAAAIYLGAIVISGNGVFTNASTFTIYPGGLFRQVGGSGGGGSLVTQTLAGLSDVNISGPTNGQPLVYNNISGKWENSSTLTATLTGNASTATTASFALTASYVLNAVSASYALSASSAEQANTASYVLQAVSSSFASTASFVQNAQTASFVLNAVSASYAATASSADDFLIRQNVTASNALITGTLTAQTIIAQYITSSTEFITGSTKFGTLLTDTHQFTGSVTITGSLSLNNSPVITDATFTPFSSSVSTRVTNLESTASVLTNASASFASDSGSNSIRLTNLESTASVLTVASASFASDSGSNSIRLTNLESTASVLTTASASFAIVSSSFATTSASLSTRVTTLENASASFAQQSGSNSIRLTNLETTASVLTFASASFALVSASYAELSGSFRTGSYTGSFTGTLFGTASWANNAVTSSHALFTVSASYAATASSADNFLIRQNATASNLLVNNTITAQTLVVQTVTSSIVYSSGSNIFGNQLTDVQQFTGSLRVTGSGNHYIMGGNVGFGTLTPNSPVEIAGSLNSGRSLIRITNTDTSNYITIGAGIPGISNAGTNFTLDGTSRAVISAGGNFGVNNISPVYKLDVAGDANITANLTATGSIRFPSLSNANQLNVVGYNTSTGELFYQNTSSLSVASASYANYAATSSYAVNFTIQNSYIFAGTVTDYATVNSSVVGSNNLFTYSTESYTSAFFKYTVTNATNARTGEVMAVWNGANIQFTDNSTLDIGSTTPVTCSVSLVGSDVLFDVQTNTSGWRIKSIGTFM